MSRSELEFLHRAIQKRQIPTPISQIGLQSVSRGNLFGKLGPLVDAPKATALALLEYALREPAAAPEATAVQNDLVWTGPEVHLSSARPTTAVVLELLQLARQSVVIAGYEFDHGAVLFAALHKVMQDHGVKVSIFLDIRRASTKKTNMDSYLALEAYKFIEKNWPFGGQSPQLFYFPDGAAAGSHKSMHAKCIVVDGERVLIGSANFTKRGHERNIEVGVCSKDPALAKALVAQLERSVEIGTFERLPSPTKPKQFVPEELEEVDEDSAEFLDSVYSMPAGLQEQFDELELDSRLWKLYSEIAGRGCETPEVGEDIESAKGEVIGTAELSWEEQKVAVLMDEQIDCRRALESDGWTCFTHDEFIENRDALWGLLERGE